MDFDFKVEYRVGALNKAADALLRRHDPIDATLYAMFNPRLCLFYSIREELTQNSSLQQLQNQVQNGDKGADWAVREGLILYKNRVYVPHASALRHTIVAAIHNSTHEGIQKTFHRVKADFYWEGLRGTVTEFVQNCSVCQQNKWENLHPARLLQPLPIPIQVWADISMDFVEGLPKVGGKSVLFVVVDWFSKMAHFIPIAHPYTALFVAHVFFDKIFRLHGVPKTIVSDRDKIFTSTFWKELFRLCNQASLSFSLPSD